jgi:hypothetical protein
MQAPQPHGTASLWHQPSLPPVPSAAASAADAASERADEGEGEGEGEGEREGKSLGESHNGGPSVDEVVREILRVRQSSVDLGSLLEAVESSLIRYSLTRNRSITDVMSHLKLSRGKLDFKRRKYKLMDFAPQPTNAD